jgi:pimeloyl-ACP methyl ester carboxylesterase
MTYLVLARRGENRLATPRTVTPESVTSRWLSAGTCSSRKIWETQRSLTDEGYRLVVPTRRAYGVGAAGRGEDYVTAAEDVAPLLGDGAHLVGHSYGALVTMLVAAARPDAVRSLTLVEQPATRAAAGDADVAFCRGRPRTGLRGHWQRLGVRFRTSSARSVPRPRRSHRRCLTCGRC